MKFLIGPLRAENANLLANDFVAGLPSPGAAIGFAGALLRHAGIEGWTHKVFFIIHSAECRKGRQRANPSVEGGILKPIEVMEGLSGNVVFSLIVDTPHFVSTGSLSKSLNLLRFSGGVISPHPQRNNDDVLFFNQSVDSIDPNATLSEIRLPRGYALVPPQAHNANDIVSFGDFATLCLLRNRGYTRRKGQGHCVPVACGYRVLENPRAAKPRLGSRGKYPHVFAEPAVGLGEFVSIRSRALPVPLAELEPYSWCWSCDFDRHLFMFSPAHLRASIKDISQ